MPILSVDFNDNPNDGEKGGVLEAPVIYYSERFDLRLELPIGTPSNYGNVPGWVPPWLVPRGAEYRITYYIHDYLYDNPEIVPKWKADLIMMDVMNEIAPKRSIRACIAYLGVGLNIPRWIWWKKPVPWKRRKHE